MYSFYNSLYWKRSKVIIFLNHAFSELTWMTSKISLKLEKIILFEIEIVFCCIVFSVSTFVENFESVRTIFPCYQDHKKWTKGKFCQPEAAGRGLVMFPRFTFCDRDNMEKLFEYFQIYLRRCMKQEKQCNRVLFFIFPVFSLLDQCTVIGTPLQSKSQNFDLTIS